MPTTGHFLLRTHFREVIQRLGGPTVSKQAERGPACSLNSAEGDARRDRWLDLTERAMLTKGSTPSGVQLRYRADDAVERELRTLADLERDCCSFAAWRISAEDGELVLDVSGQGDGIAAVRAMFDELPPETPPA